MAGATVAGAGGTTKLRSEPGIDQYTNLGLTSGPGGYQAGDCGPLTTLSVSDRETLEITDKAFLRHPLHDCRWAPVVATPKIADGALPEKTPGDYERPVTTTFLARQAVGCPIHVQPVFKTRTRFQPSPLPPPHEVSNCRRH